MSMSQSHNNALHTASTQLALSLVRLLTHGLHWAHHAVRGKLSLLHGLPYAFMSLQQGRHGYGPRQASTFQYEGSICAFPRAWRSIEPDYLFWGLESLSVQSPGRSSVACLRPLLRAGQLER